MKCKHCFKICSDLEEMQLHMVSECSAIEDEDGVVTSPTSIEIILRWKPDLEMWQDDAVELLLSDVDDAIKLKRNVSNGCYISDIITLQSAKYVGQMISGNEMYPLKEIMVNDGSKEVEVQVEKSISKKEVKGTLRNNESEMVLKENEMNRVDGKRVDYELNVKANLAKKLNACKRHVYEVTKHDACCVIMLSTSAFEYFKNYVTEYIGKSLVYQIKTNEKLIDLANNIPQDTIKVASRNNLNKHLFTINLYRTASKVLINGKSFNIFVENDLPSLLDKLMEIESEIDEANYQCKLSIAKATQFINEQSEIPNSLDDNGYNISCKRIRKKKVFLDCEMMEGSRRKTRSSFCEDVDGNVSKNEANDGLDDDWMTEPKFWNKCGNSDWTCDIANNCNRRKGCLQLCGKNNSRDMVRCDGCGGWCHIKCLPQTEQNIEDQQDSICTKCQKML